jgi:hypothetical protein
MALGLGRRVLRSHNLSEGAFGITHTAELDGSPWRVVVKGQKRLGQAVREARQLDLRAEYRRRILPDERLGLRQAFCRFWYELQTYARIRWRQDETNTWITQQLRDQMDKWL